MQIQPVLYAPRSFVSTGEVPEKLCSSCDEGWPADEEFFFREKRQADGLSRVCKACYNERPSMLKRRQRKQE